MDHSDVIIITNNLCLKSIELKYQNDIFTEFTAEITGYMFPKPAEKIDETIEFIEKSIRENRAGTNFQVVILDKNSQEFLGCGGLHRLDRKTPEFGIWIKKSAHGHGYGKEAIIALKDWANKNLHYKYLLYPVARENIASRKIPEFLGGKVFREYENVSLSGRNLHLLEYRIYPPEK